MYKYKQERLFLEQERLRAIAKERARKNEVSDQREDLNVLLF
jgi:hypothetical protein